MLYRVFLHPSCPPGDTSHSIILIKLKSQARWPGEQLANDEEQRTSEVLKVAVTTVVVFLICCIPVTTNLVLVDLATEKFYSILYTLIYLSGSFLSVTNAKLLTDCELLWCTARLVQD